MNKKLFIWLGIAVFLIIFVISTIYDLQISYLIADLKSGEYYSSNAFAVIFEIIGESPLYLFLAFAFVIIFWWLFYNVKNKRLLNFLYLPLASVAIFLSFYFMVARILKYLEIHQTFALNQYFLILSLFLSLIFTILIIFSLKFVKQENIGKLLSFAFLILFVATFSNLITQFIKGNIFGRMRFQAMNQLEDFSYFTPWFYINGTSLYENLSGLGFSVDAFKSFPSGHTTAAGILFTLICLPLIFEKLNNKKSKLFCWIIPFIIVFVVGFSRIVAGAHFSTDVLMAMLITFSLTILGKYLFIK
ncbi:MAG: phosphatase PAP2 family protein [Clostridia bacterium]|nr:phosphatase PAP2 family protein [Clostridia bacterium]